MKATAISEDEFVDAAEANMGWCRHCDAFTREFTEPDATDYDCEDCEETDVVGAEQALIEGLLVLK